MLLEFVCKWLGLRKPDSVVEGDDSLSNMKDGRCPTTEDFAQMGMIIKCEEHTALSEASFCGLVYDEDDKVNITNPLEVLSSIGWLCGRYAKSRDAVLLALLRCKGLSLIYQYPGAPIFCSLGRAILRLTRGIDVRKVPSMRHVNSWERDMLLDIVRDEKRIRKLAELTVPTNTRMLMERLFGVTVEQQVKIERYFDCKKNLDDFDFDLDVHPHWTLYDHHYTREVQVNDDHEPYFLYGAIRGHGQLKLSRGKLGLPMFL